MNSYPIELLVQHAPLMFVAGLEIPAAKQDPFHSLVVRLRELLSARPKGLVWDKNRGSAFNILLVDKNIRFPPRKVVPTNEPGQSAPHSPLSPLVPSSPLYPDGLIAPVWVRKHVELVPSIFVLFLRLWESPPPLSPLEGREQEMEEERFHDQELAAELSARKRALAERGIKLTAVLLASRKLLDDPGLDGRLTFLRRQSALDARAALFVLSPVINTELQDFVHSLTEALREPSIEYYAAHSKRVRRKRNKHTSSAYSGYPTSALATTRAVPLRPIGWTVRYEYKLGTFAEFRFEEEVARKHYEDCWNALSEMFNSVTVLPPRTKRWAEAKVLADSVAIKIYKLYLYNSEHALALSYFNRHVKRFCDLSRSWGIGEDTFEYWSWAARQYRILAEVLEIALRAGLRLPLSLPQHVEERPQQLDLEPPPVPGLAPANTLQHPGYYYFQAARYTQERYKRFKTIEDAEIIQPTGISQSPAFNNEKKAEHWEVILELYSKAYEQFKRHAAGQSRLTFWVAVQIATAYHASGKHELASKFFERIVKVYHKERWQAMLRPILNMWYESSKRVGNIETCIKLLVERMASGSQEENAIIAEDLLEILRTTKPGPESSPLVVELSPSEQILSAAVIFYEEHTSVGGKTPFQLRITTPPSASLHILSIKSLRIHFSDNRQPATVNHVAVAEDSPSISLGDIGDAESEVTQKEGNLSFIPGTTQVLFGTISSASATELKVTKLTLSLLEAEWKVDVNFGPSIGGDLEPLWRHSPDGNWKDVLIHRPSPSSVVFRPCSHNFKVDINHVGHALVGESYPVVISVNNNDTRSLSITMDVLLQPAEDESVNHISVDDQRSTSLVRRVSFGTVEPGSSIDRTVTLMSSGPGKRVLDFSFQPRGIGVPSAVAEENETLITVSVDTIKPFRQDTYITYSQPRESLPVFLEVTGFENWDGYRAEATVALTIDCVADCELEIMSIKFIDINSVQSRLLGSSLPSEQVGPLSWLPGDSFAVEARIGVGLHTAEPVPPPVESYSSPVQVELSWRRANRNEPDAASTITILSLPDLKPPTFGLTVLIDPPATTKIHTPFTLDVKVRNNDPHRSADLNFILEPAEGFVMAGFRNGGLPLLLPGTEEFLSFNLIPISVGNVKLPIFKIQQTLKGEPAAPRPDETNARVSTVVDTVPVVDKRWDSLDGSGNNVHFYTSDGETLTELDLSLWLSVLTSSASSHSQPHSDPYHPRTFQPGVMNIVIPEYTYEVIPGWFVQDQPTAPTTELPDAFGILDTSEQGWKRVKDFIAQENGDNRVPGTIHKLFFLGRHGQGWHNVAETKYGTLQWDLYWSKLDGDGEITWGPDPGLTPLGVEQALTINKMWRDQLPKGIPMPDAMYISPFRRAIMTQEITFKGWFYAGEREPGMDISSTVVRIAIEDLHEDAGEHTCDHRSSKTVLQQEFPWLYFENGFAEEDPLWSPDHRETGPEHDIRSKKALDKLMTADGAYISVTSHSGTMASIFRVIGHQPYNVGPGGVVPVLIKATQVSRPTA